MAQGRQNLFADGAVFTQDDTSIVRAVRSGTLFNTVLTLNFSDGGRELYALDSITAQPNTDRIAFRASNTTYKIREFREDDGTWLSKYKIDLPLESLERLATQVNEGDQVATVESLDAYALDDSIYVLGLVYSDGTGRYARVDGDWVLLAPNDSTYNDMIAMSIDPARAQEYVDLYDRNHITITDTEEYEVADPDTKEE